MLMNSHDLQAYMKTRGIPGEILRLGAPTATVETAALALGVRTEQIVKSILFLVKDDPGTAGYKPALAITCGTGHVDKRRIGAHFGVGHKRVRTAFPEEVLALSGYAVGAMPPFGHRQPLATLLDRRVLGLPEAYAGGGDENAIVRLDPQDILRFTNAVVLDLTSPEEEINH